MQPLVRWLGSMLLLALMGFCVYGFLASGEAPPESKRAFQIVYAVIGLAALFGLIQVLRSHWRR